MTEKLYILWTNDNPITAEKMVCMYAHNSVLNEWWDEVTVIIWGATAKLIAENNYLQLLFKQMQKDGVTVSACKACADQLGVSETIEDLGIELKYWGEGLTNIIKSNDKLITV